MNHNTTKSQINSERYSFNTSNDLNHFTSNYNDFAEFENAIDISDDNTHCDNCSSISNKNSIQNNTLPDFNPYTNLTFHNNTKQQQKPLIPHKNNIHSIIKAYAFANCNNSVHSNIINLCAIFCTISQTFDIKTSLNANIYGLNTIATFNNSNGYVSTNLLTGLGGKYRWAFKITDCFTFFQSITFSLLQNNTCITCHSIPAKNAMQYGIGNESYAPFGNDKIFYIYFDINGQNIVFKNNKQIEFFRTQIKNKLNKTDNYQLRIFVSKQARIEIIGFESSENGNYYSNILSDNTIKYIKYGLCSEHIKDKLMYFTKALDIGPIAKVYQKEYLYMLMEAKLFSNIYEFIYKYDIICSDLWEDEELKEMDLIFEAGYLCNELMDINNAIKYYKMCIDYYNNKYKSDIMCICIANLGQIYVNWNDSESAINTLRLLDRFIGIKENYGTIYGNNMILKSSVMDYDCIVNSVYNNGAELFKWYIKDRMNWMGTNIKEKKRTVEISLVQ